MEKADAVLILGEDILNTAPMAALAVRQAFRNVPMAEAVKKGIPDWNDSPLREYAQRDGSPVFVVTPFADSLDEIADESYHSSQGSISDLGFAMAKAIDEKHPGKISLAPAVQRLAGKIAQTLKKAKNPLIISGISCGDEAVVQAAMDTASALAGTGQEVMLYIVLPECNSLGLSLMGGKPFEEILADGGRKIDTLLILENDLYRSAEEDSVNELLRRSRQVIVVDHLLNMTAQKADILLPAATFAESEGTLVNSEGRAQRYYKVLVPGTKVKDSWAWIEEIGAAANPETGMQTKSADSLLEELAGGQPLFSKLRSYRPDADFRMLNAKMPRQTPRYSGRTAMHANIEVSEQKLPADPDSPFAFSMEGIPENPPSSLVPFYWKPGWNSVQAFYGYIDEEGSLRGGDPGIRLIPQSGEPGTAYFGTCISSSAIR